MKQNILLITLILVGSASLGLAENQVITLKDGSQIKGELVSVNKGHYTVRSSTLGDVNVDSSQVATISNPSVVHIPAQATAPTSTDSSNNSDLNQRIQTAQSKLMADPQMMAQLTEMMQDPELMQLLSDPTLTQAVMSRDVKAIEGNPKAQQLMNNPKMRALMEQLRSKESK